MKIAVKLFIEIKKGLLPVLSNELYKKECEIIKMTHLSSNSIYDTYEFFIVYAKEDKFNKLVHHIGHHKDKVRKIEVERILDEKVVGGLLSLAGKLECEKAMDYEVNILGAHHVIKEKINTHENPVLYTGIVNAVGLINALKKSGEIIKKKFYEYYASQEVDSLVLQKFANLNGFPYGLYYQQKEDVIRMLSLSEHNFSAYRIAHLEDDDNLDFYQEIIDSVNLPVLSRSYDEIPVFLLATLFKMMAQHGLELETAAIGIIGLDVSVIRVARMLRKKGSARIFGFDNNEKLMLSLEREGGVATSQENIFNNCNIIFLCKNHFSDDDLNKNRSDIIVLSLLDDEELEKKIKNRETCKLFVKSNLMELGIIFPGLLRGMLQNSVKSLDDAMIVTVASTLAAFKTENSMFPDIFSSIHHDIAGVFQEQGIE